MATSTAPTAAQVADALRALADLIQWADGNPEWYAVGGRSGEDIRPPAGFKSHGYVARMVAGMTDVRTEPYDTETTHYLIYRGRLLGQRVTVMESQDD